jgi:UDP-N-acetylglucosamine acyltransferase
MPSISPHALIEKGASLADDVRVGAFAYIGSNVRIGEGCVIENNATIVGKTTLGARNHVLPLAVIGAPPDGGGEGQTIVGDANVFREHATVAAGAQTPTRIGSGNLIMIGCHIGAGAAVGDHTILVNCTHVGEGVVVEDYVRTSAFVVFEPGITVGAYAFTLGYGQIDRDVPPFSMAQGSPFRVRGVNNENLKRCGFGQDDIRALKTAFRELFDGEGDPSAAAGAMLARGSLNPHVRRVALSLRPAGSGA